MHLPDRTRRQPGSPCGESVLCASSFSLTAPWLRFSSLTVARRRLLSRSCARAPRRPRLSSSRASSSSNNSTVVQRACGVWRHHRHQVNCCFCSLLCAKMHEEALDFLEAPEVCESITCYVYTSARFVQLSQYVPQAVFAHSLKQLPVRKRRRKPYAEPSFSKPIECLYANPTH